MCIRDRDEGVDEGGVEEEVVKEDYPSPPEKNEPIIPEEEDEDKFSLDNLLTETKRPDRPKPKKKVKRTSKAFQPEIIEEGLVPRYNVSVPHFTEKETLIFNEVREKLVEVAVSDVYKRQKLGDWFSNSMQKINYEKINLSVICFMSFLVVFFGFMEGSNLIFILLIYITAISMGLLPPVSYTHLLE